MAQKVFTLILVLMIIIGLAWYLNKTYIQPTTSQSVSSKIPQYKSTSSDIGQAKLIYSTYDNAKEIWEVSITDNQKQTRKLFTDADETEKIIKLSNLAILSGEVFAIVSTDIKPYSGKLVSIDISNSSESVVLKSFLVPNAWTLSADGKKIAYSTFSNVEENYGYNLYSQERDGSNIRELTNSDSEIVSPAWNLSATKIVYVTTSGTKSAINLINIDAPEVKTIAEYDNKIIDWLSWSDDNLVFSIRDINSTSKGAIEIINSQGENLEKITDFEGGIANFSYLKENFLGFIVAQYPESQDSEGKTTPNDLTTGQIYIYNLAQDEKIPIQKGIQILGWLPEEQSNE